MRRSWTYLAMVVLLLLGAAASSGQESKDANGGGAPRVAATGWFRTLRIDDRWWFVDPAGQLFLSLGVDGVSLTPNTTGMAQSAYREAVQRKYGQTGIWAKHSATRLKQWGFNTLGIDSDPIMRRQDLPYTLLLGLSGASGGAFPDVFASSYPRESRQIARRLCRPLANDPRLIGYFIDENLSWDPDALFLQYMSFGNFSPGRKALLHFLQARYPTLEELNQAWRTSYSSFEEIGRVPQARAVIPEEIKHGFLQLVAERYFKLAQEAIRSVDANHLILGCRLPSRAPTLVFEAMRERVDVVSISNCDAPSSSAALLEIYRITQRPLLITGLGGLPTTEAQGLLLEAPAARGAPYTRSVEELLALPMVVGGHWRRHTDRPAGDSPGEEGATGLVDIQDEPHADFVTTVTRTNQQAYELHAGLNNPTDVE